MENEALENGQREATLKDLEVIQLLPSIFATLRLIYFSFLIVLFFLIRIQSVIEGINDLVTPDRTFLLFELVTTWVTMPIGQGTRKERGFFLFSDLLVITSIKRRNGTIRKLE